MPTSKKIVRLFSRLNIGGPALHVVNLAVGLEEFGYKTILVVGSCDASEGTMEDYARNQGAELKVIPSFQAALSLAKDWDAFLQICKLLKAERPEIVHTHTFKAGLLGRLAAWICGVPVVIHTYHGHLFSGYGSKARARVLAWVEWALGLITTRILAVSAQVAEDLVRLKIAPRTKVSVVELGFNMEQMENDFARPPTLRADLNLTEQDTLIGVVGRLVPVKAIDLFLEALGPLLDHRPRLHLVIIGDGQERARLEALASKVTDQRKQIHFTGWRKPATKDLSDLDLCICSSKNEGTSVSIIEAVIAGVPVISTRVGGMGDLLEQGRWGELVEWDPQSLRDAVSRFLDEPLPRHLKEGSAYFRARFSLPRLLSEMDRTYRREDAHV